MKKFLCVLLAAMFLLGTAAVAENKVTVSAKNWVELEEKGKGFFFAKIENNTENPLAMDEGKLVGFSAEDEVVVSEDYMMTDPYDLILQPGEYAYIYETVYDKALEDSDVAEYKFSMGVDDLDMGEEYGLVPCEVSLELSDTDPYGNFVYVTFTNNTEEVMYNSVISAALFDSENNLLYVVAEDFDELGVHPGSTVTVRLYIDSDIVEHYQKNNVSVTSADALVRSRK